jgi:hypothetical protein
MKLIGLGNGRMTGRFEKALPYEHVGHAGVLLDFSLKSIMMSV